jgi:hypothetical protein
VEETPRKLLLRWHGARFPAFLCLGIALLLLLVSVPIVEALRLRGFVGPAGSLWYFPIMNLILLGISAFLLTQRRTIEIDDELRRLTLRRQSLYRSIVLAASYDEVTKLVLGVDQVYSGFALGGSTAAESFPVPALRVTLQNGRTVLLDRGSLRKLADLGQLIGRRLNQPLDINPELQAQLDTSGGNLREGLT